MTKDAFLRELETALDREPGSISTTSALEEIEWDSLAEIAFVSFADQKLGVAVVAKQVASCKTVADLIKLVGPNVAD